MRKLQLWLPGSHSFSTASPTQLPRALSITARSSRSGWSLRLAYQSRNLVSSARLAGSASSWMVPVSLSVSGAGSTCSIPRRSSSVNGRSTTFSPVIVGLTEKSGVWVTGGLCQLISRSSETGPPHPSSYPGGAAVAYRAWAAGYEVQVRLLLQVSVDGGPFG